MEEKGGVSSSQAVVLWGTYLNRPKMFPPTTRRWPRPPLPIGPPPRWPFLSAVSQEKSLGRPLCWPAHTCNYPLFPKPPRQNGVGPFSRRTVGCLFTVGTADEVAFSLCDTTIVPAPGWNIYCVQFVPPKTRIREYLLFFLFKLLKRLFPVSNQLGV